MTASDDPPFVPPKAFEDFEHGLSEIRDALWDLAFHDEPLDPFEQGEIEYAVQSLIRVAVSERLRRRQELQTGRLPMNLGQIACRGIKVLRGAAEITQEELATLMNDLGFVTWKRITVAEIESGKRKIGIEEMLGIAILFDVPVGFLLTSFESDEVLQLNERMQLTAAQTQELMTGWPMERSWLGVRLHSTTAGAMAVGVTADSEEDWRPANSGTLWAHAMEAEDAMVLRPGRSGFRPGRVNMDEG